MQSLRPHPSSVEHELEFSEIPKHLVCPLLQREKHSSVCLLFSASRVSCHRASCRFLTSSVVPSGLPFLRHTIFSLLLSFLPFIQFVTCLKCAKKGDLGRVQTGSERWFSPPAGSLRAARPHLSELLGVHFLCPQAPLLGDCPKPAVRKECKEMCRKLITTMLFVIVRNL